MKKCGLFTTSLGALALAALPLPAAAKMNLNINSLSADGQELQKISCQLSDGGLMASFMLVGAVAKQKKAFDACAPAGAAFAIKWTWAGGKVTKAEVTASSEAKAAACVAAAFKQIKAPIAGDCSAIVLTGKNDVAKQAAEKLSGNQAKGDKAAEKPAADETK